MLGNIKKIYIYLLLTLYLSAVAHDRPRIHIRATSPNRQRKAHHHSDESRLRTSRLS